MKVGLLTELIRCSVDIACWVMASSMAGECGKGAHFHTSSTFWPLVPRKVTPSALNSCGLVTGLNVLKVDAPGNRHLEVHRWVQPECKEWTPAQVRVSHGGGLTATSGQAASLR